MSATPLTQFTENVLRPAYNDEDARTIPVNLAPGTYARGQVLGEVTSTGANDVQTVTIGGSPTGGTWTLTATPLAPYKGQAAVTLTEPYNVTLAALQADLEQIYGAGNVIVTGTAGSSYVITATGGAARQQITVAVVSGSGLTGGTSPSASIAHTTTGAADTGTYGAYASGNSDGTQNPKGLLMYPCSVDANGNITIASEIPGYTQLSAPMYRAGAFRTEEIVGLDSNAVTKLAGVIVAGSTSAGVFEFGAP